MQEFLSVYHSFYSVWDCIYNCNDVIYTTESITNCKNSCILEHMFQMNVYSFFPIGFDTSGGDAHLSCDAHHVDLSSPSWPVWLQRACHQLAPGCSLLFQQSTTATFRTGRHDCSARQGLLTSDSKSIIPANTSLYIHTTTDSSRRRIASQLLYNTGMHTLRLES